MKNTTLKGAKTTSRSTLQKSNSSSMRSNSKGASNGSGQKENLSRVFEDTLKDIYWAEKQLTKTLPKMKKAATTDDLKSAIEEHLAQTEGHVKRLEQVFDMCGKKVQAKKCDAMEGLIKEGDSIVEETQAGSMTRDAGIIMAAQKVEHYEIATYGGLTQLAQTMGNDEVAALLEETLAEEKEADSLLTTLAESGINSAAAREGMAGENDNGEDVYDSINLNKKTAKK